MKKLIIILMFINVPILIMGAILLRNFGNSKDSVDRLQVDILFRYAKSGHLFNDPVAEYKVSQYYKYGKYSFPKDETKYIYWLTKAAENGKEEAQHELGVCYSLGEYGLPQDREIAFKWYKEAAKRGCIDAMFSLGLHYMRVENKQEAIYWFVKHIDEYYEKHNEIHELTKINLQDLEIYYEPTNWRMEISSLTYSIEKMSKLKNKNDNVVIQDVSEDSYIIVENNKDRKSIEVYVKSGNEVISKTMIISKFLTKNNKGWWEYQTTSNEFILIKKDGLSALAGLLCYTLAFEHNGQIINLITSVVNPSPDPLDLLFYGL